MLEERGDKYYYKPDGSSREMTIQVENDEVEIFDYRNSFYMEFHIADKDVAIDILRKIAHYELTSDAPRDYRPRFSHYMDSNHVDRQRAPHIIDMINTFFTPINLDSITIDKLKDASLNRLVVIHDEIQKQRKEKLKCLEQSLKEQVN